MDMIHAIMRSEPENIFKIELNGKEFILECDTIAMQKGIDSLRDKFNNAPYGYQQYACNPEVNLTEKEYQANIDEFQEEFEKRLEYNYVKGIIDKAKKKKNGTLYKARVYDEFILGNSANNGSGATNIYKVKYQVVDDLVIRLIFHYATEYLTY